MADELLKGLGRLQRAQQAESAAAGARDDADTDELLRPLDAAEQAEILAGLLEPREQAASPAPTLALTPVAEASEPTKIAGHADAGGASNVVPLVRPPRRWIAGVTALAAAAALFLVLRPGGPAEGLPLYGVTQASGEAVVRGDGPATASTLVVRPGTTVDLIVTPASAIRGPVDLRVVASQGEQHRWIDVTAVRSTSADGVIRLRGRAGAWLDLPPGTWTLTLVIGRPDRLPADLAAYAAAADRPQDHGWQLQRVEVQVEG